MTSNSSNFRRPPTVTSSSSGEKSPRSLSPRSKPVNPSIAARAAAVSVALSKPRDLTLFQNPRPSSSVTPSHEPSPDGIDITKLPAYLGEGELPENAPVTLSEVDGGAVVNTSAPSAPSLSAGGKAAPLDWREREAALRKIHSESTGADGQSTSTPEQIAARLARMMAMSGRPVFSYLGGSSPSSLSSVSLNKSDGPIKSQMISAPSMSPIGAAGTDGFAPVSLAVITGQLSKLRKIAKPPVDFKKKDEDLPPWARAAKPSEVSKGTGGIRFAMGKAPSTTTGRAVAKSLPPLSTDSMEIHTAKLNETAGKTTALLVGNTQTDHLSSALSGGFVSIPPVWANLSAPNDTENPSAVVCWTCHGEIVEDKSIEVDGREFHLECFICCACKIPLGEGDLLTVKDRFYHSSCLRCNHCNVDCENKDIAVGENGEIYCKKHAMLSKGLEIPSVPCAGCRAPIYDDPDVQVAAIGENYFHLQCLICACCKESLLQQKAFSHGAYFYCERDFVNLFALECTTCNQFVEGPCVQITNKVEDPVTKEQIEYKYSFHPDHFRCNRCNGDLRKMGFIIHENELLCAEDFEALA